MDDPDKRQSASIAIWRLYALGSLAAAVGPGFLLGAGLFALRFSRESTSAWELAAGSSHGHSQVFGWAGLLVLGVALHFLPRLAGVRSPRPDLAYLAFLLLFVGMMVRVFSQPLAASGPDDGVFGLLLLAGAGAELGGACLAIGLLVAALARRESRVTGPAVRQVLPFLALTALGLILALSANLIRFLSSGGLPDSRFAGDLDQVVILAGFYFFLLPISIGMSVRTFPLYIQGLPVRVRPLQLGLLLLVAGTLGRIIEVFDGADTLLRIGSLHQGVGLGLMVAAVRVFDRRRPLPRREVRPLRDARQIAIIGAYLWLSLAALLLILDGVGMSSLDRDVEIHLIGTGFVTLLIFGVGAHLLPGFGRSGMRSEAVAWTVTLLGNIAVLCRLFPHLSSGNFADFVAGAAGILGILAVTIFAWNVGLLSQGKGDVPAR